MKLEGVIVPAAVPLGHDRSPDLPAYGRLLERLLASGVHGIFVNGSMGAFALLTDAAQVRLAQAAVEFAGGRVPVLVGASDTGTGRVIERIRVLESLPVAGVVVLPPYFFPADQRELLRFYLAVADAARKPVILYDNPRLARNALSVPVIVQLARHPNIIGIKLSGPDPAMWRELLAAPLDRAGFSLICGAGRLTNVALRMGFDGITEGLHNLVPALAVQLYQAERNGEIADGDRLQATINRCFAVFETDGGWRGLEVAFQHLGISPCAALPPYDLEIDELSRTKII